MNTGSRSRCRLSADRILLAVLFFLLLSGSLETWRACVRVPTGVDSRYGEFDFTNYDFIVNSPRYTRTDREYVLSRTFPQLHSYEPGENVSSEREHLNKLDERGTGRTRG